jgi:hypothetical protein
MYCPCIFLQFVVTDCDRLLGRNMSHWLKYVYACCVDCHSISSYEQGPLDRHFALNTDVMFLDVRVEMPGGPTLTLNSLKECNVVNHTLKFSKNLLDGPPYSEAPVVFTSSTQDPTRISVIRCLCAGWWKGAVFEKRQKNILRRHILVVLFIERYIWFYSKWFYTAYKAG